MLSKAFDLFLGWLKSQRYWGAIEPFLIIVLTWGGAQLLSFEWISAKTTFKPSFSLFLRSYLSHWITIGALGLAGIVLLFRSRPSLPTQESASRLRVFWSANRRIIIYRTVGTMLILSLVALGLRWYTPSRVSHITVRFMDLDSDMTPEGLAYLIYEINRLQPNWYFETDFDPFNPQELTSAQVAQCAEDERPRLCQATILSNGRPFVGITAQPLGHAFFAEHRGVVSVITTSEKPVYAPLTNYEYRFGRDYVATCANLLTMDWLYSDRVKNNFQRVFNTKLER